MRDIEKLKNILEDDQVFSNELLANHSTLRIGGPADLLYRAMTIKQLVRAIKNARRLKVPITILGWGSNVLIGDKGIRGLVIKNETRKITIGNSLPSPTVVTVPPLRKYGEGNGSTLPRWQADKSKGTFKYEFNDLDYDESVFPRIRVKMASGTALGMAINNLFSEGITGLQWYARIPGTLGGAVFNNIHGGTHFIAEVVKKVKVLDKENKIKVLSGKELKLAYDKSRFHSSGEIILEVEFELYKGDVERAKRAAFEWAKRKSLQPPRSAGCTFKNVSNGDKEKLGLPTTSAGYIIEHILKLGGYKIGQAMISKAHHNFIVNEGGASAVDYRRLVELIQRKTKTALGIELVPEIIYLGEF